MAGQVAAEEKKERSRLARELGVKKKQVFYRSQVGDRVRVLVERVSHKEPGFVRGYSDNYVPVTFRGGQRLINQEVVVQLDRWAGGRRVQKFVARRAFSTPAGSTPPCESPSLCRPGTLSVLLDASPAWPRPSAMV